MAKMNEMVGMNNRLVMSRGKKRLRIVCPFKRQELCKLISFIILADTYGMKVHKLWSEIPSTVGNKSRTKPR